MYLGNIPAQHQKIFLQRINRFSKSLPTDRILMMILPPGYSDDEDGAMTPAKDHRSVASVKTDATIPSDIAANFLSEGATRFSDGESDEMEEDLNIFNKTVQISDLDKVRATPRTGTGYC